MRLEWRRTKGYQHSPDTFKAYETSRMVRVVNIYERGGVFSWFVWNPDYLEKPSASGWSKTEEAAAHVCAEVLRGMGFEVAP